MQVGVVFPQIEIGADPAVVRDYAQTVEGLGYDYLIAYDHVVGPNAASRPGWSGAYDSNDMFHEPFVLFGYLAGVTERIGLVSSVIILPQRQTALVAKQAAEVDILSGGRLRLGVGIGWNEVEFEALGENFRNRGRRSEEQIELLRLLWTQELVTYEGRWHRITDAGINPLPVQRPIPIWIGGHADPVLRRIARLSDGWTPLYTDLDEAAAGIEKMHGYAREAGRNPDDIGIERWITLRDRTPEACMADVADWRRLGATYIAINTMRSGLSSIDQHVDAIRRFKDATDSL